MSVPVPAADGSTPESGGAPIPQPGIDPPGGPDEVATIPISSSVRQNAPPPVPDSDLLTAFVERKDQAALTAIVERYSTLVYRVALRSLNDRHLADDVFQATFLVLAQSARRIKDGDLLAAWLHGTARNLARRALTHKQSQRNQLAITTSLTRSQKGGEMSTPAELDPLDQLVRRHEQQLLDEELQNLPESSRAPLVLYYLEEKSQAEIALLMGLTVEAVEGRLRRAKHDLRLRLIRRGVTLAGVVAAATLLTPSFAAAAPTSALISTTITAALGTAAGTSLAAASTTAATLATKEVAAMSLASKATAFVFGTAGVLTVTAGLIFGAVVTSMGREGAERQAAARVLAERSLENEEISTELALVDEVPSELTQAAGPQGENAPGEAQKSNANQFTESPHDQSQQISDVDAEVLKLKQELSERQSVLAKDHPDVRQLEDKIRHLQVLVKARDLLRKKDDEILKWQEKYRTEQVEKEIQRDQVARREKENAELVEKLNTASSNEALPNMVTADLNWAEKMFSSLSHDFGDVAPGSVHQHVIEITNRYKETVTLTAPESSCRCGTVTLDKTVLQSKEVAHLTITLDTERFRGRRVATIRLDASFEPQNSKKVRIPVRANIEMPLRSYDYTLSPKWLRSMIVPEKPDGLISNVDHENGTVWLNIGRQQNLKPQITFSVYDKSQSGLAPSPEMVKARIEVVEIRDTSSIARVVEEIHPIAVGDFVDSPAWDAQEQEHFALSGNSDLNGDGVLDRRDRKILNDLLNYNGAVIDVEVTNEGVREPADGKLTDQTKWLVIGELSNVLAMPKQHLQLVEDARELGIRIIALKDFLTYMGWKPVSKVYLPHREVPAINDNRQSPTVARTTTITLPETDLTILPHDIVLLKFPGPVTWAEVQYDRAVDVTPLAGKTDQLRVLGTSHGSCELTVTLQNDTVHRVRFQVGTTPANRFRDMNPSEEKIRRALDQQVSLEFPDNTLKEVCSFISQLNNIPITIDTDALKAAGMNDDLKVNLVISGIKLRSALKLLLSGNTPSLDYCIDNEALVITTPAEVKNRKRLEYYRLSSLSSDSQSAAEKFITPLADSVSNLEGDLLVDGSLDAHRQLEEFLDQAHKLEMQKPPRPVELAKTLLAAPMAPIGESHEVSERSPELAKILTEWKAKSAEVRNFSGSFKRLEFDTIFATETRSQGRLKFERPDSGRIDFGPADAEWLQKPGRVTKDGKPCKIVSGEARTWLSTGTSAYALSTKDKTYNLFDIPPAFRGTYLDTLPPHSQFGMQPPPMDGSYRFELGQLHNPDGSKRDADGQTMQKAIHIVAICQAPQSDRGLKSVKFLGLEWPVFRDAPDTLEYLLDPDTYLPLNVRTLDTSGNKETVYSFDHSSMKVNEGFGSLKANPFQAPDLTGWKLMNHIKDEPAPTQELPVSATPQNEQIMLSICMFETTAATVDELTVESSGKRVPKEGFRKLLDEAVKSKKARTLCEPSIVLPLGKSGEFLSGGEIPAPVDGDQANTSNSLQFGTKFTLNPYRRSAEGLFVAISGELSNLRYGKDDDDKGADLPTVEGQIIRALVMIPGSTHQAIVGPIWKSERMNSSGETEKVGIYLRIREDAFRDLPATVPAAPTLVPSETETTSAAQPETIARVIDLAELPQTTPSEVAEALKLLVEPESWNGTRDIKPLGKSIVVRNRSEVVEQCVTAIDEMIASEKKRSAEEREKATQSSPEP